MNIIPPSAAVRGHAESARRRAWVKRSPGSASASVPRPTYSIGSTNSPAIVERIG